MENCAGSMLDGRGRSGRRWYAVHTLPRAEITAKQNLTRQGFDVFLPQILTTRRHARKLETIKAPLFPRYGFISLDLTRERWRVVNGTIGVQNLIMGRDSPRAVPHGIVEDLVSRANGDGVVDLDHHFRPGDAVRLVAGPLAQQIGILAQLGPNDRVEILLQLIAGPVRVNVAREALEPAP